MKRHLTLLIIRERQIKTMIRYHLTLVRMAIIKKSIKSSEKGVEKWEPSHTHWWECEMVQPLWRTVWGFLKKLKREFLCDPTVPLLGIYPEKMKTLILKSTCILKFFAALSTIAKTCKQPRCSSTDKWIKKMWYIHKMEHYSAIKRMK